MPGKWRASAVENEIAFEPKSHTLFRGLGFHTRYCCQNPLVTAQHRLVNVCEPICIGMARRYIASSKILRSVACAVIQTMVIGGSRSCITCVDPPNYFYSTTFFR